MKKRFFLIFSGLMLTFSAAAGPLTPGEALQRLKNQSGAPTRTMRFTESELLYTAETDNGEAALYVFGGSKEEGYCILSADEAGAPLLGYSEAGKFDGRNMAPAMKWWLEEYVRQISYASENNLSEYSTRAEDGRNKVAPLMKTTWNQTAPYNNLTPLINGKHAPTGCVATAMAQIMKFWGYPSKASGKCEITLPSSQEKESFNLGEEKLQWDLMLDSYSGSYSEDQAHAVAYLMKAAGYASNMHYGKDASSAFSYIAAKALMNNFSYNPKMQYCSRDYFSSSDWEALIYNEISSGRPVLYGGQSTSVGHEFVCDGYAGEGFFHFNWGWSGMSDGYFLLNSLNPGALGTGGGLGGGFNFGQDAIVGIQPDFMEVVPPYLVQYGALSAEASGSSITVTLRSGKDISNWLNTGLSDLSVVIGASFEQDGSSDSPTYVSVRDIRVPKPVTEEKDGGLNLSYYGIKGEMTFTAPASLKDGNYKVTIVVKSSTGVTWTPVLTLPQYSNFFYLEKKGNSITVKNVENAEIKLVSAQVLSELYYNNLAKLRIEATNESGKELTAGFYPQLYSGNTEVMEGDGIVLTIPPHSTITKEFFTTLRKADNASEPKEPAIYQLVWFDPMTSEFYQKISEEVTVNVTPPTPDLTIDDFAIEGVEPKLTQVDGVGSLMVSTIEGIEDVEFTFNVSNKTGYFGYPLYVVLFEMGDNYSKMSASCAPVVLTESNVAESTYASSNLGALKKSTVYLAIVFYRGAQGMSQVMSCPPLYFRIVESAGVDDISIDEETTVKYYNLQGQEIENPSKGMLLIKKQGSQTEKIIY